MKHLSKYKHILFPALAFLALVAFLPGLAGADFNVAWTGAIEVKPAVAYNSQTGKFLVAYLEEEEDLTYGVHYELRCQLHNADGTKSGGVLMPLGVGTHEALGRPAIDYNPNMDRFFVAIPAREEGKSGEFVMGRFLNGNGASLVGPDWLFNDGVSTYHEADISEDVNSLRVVCNTLLNEFMVTVQRTVPDIYPPPWDHRNVISAQRISYSSGLIGSVVQLADYGTGGIDGHAIAYAPISGTTPAGGRYLFANAGFVGEAQLLDSGGNSITGVPLDLGEPSGGNTHPDIAYGEVDGKKRFLMVYSDEDNCRPGFDPCAGNLFDQWTGVWGAYIDPLVTSYGASGNNTPFPISYIWSHLAVRRTCTPRVSYNPDHKSFAVVWREIPFLDLNNDESRSHIRGNVVDYYVADGLYGSSVPLPASDSNVVISDVSGTCPSGVPCYSNEDPKFPDVSASYGSSAVVVWHQTYSSTDLDVWGDFFSDFNYPAGDELAADFGTNGLWHYDGASWSKLTTWNPDDDLAGWSGGLAVDFGGDGLWNHDGTSWSQKTSWNPGSGGLAGWSGGLAVDFDADGLWVYDGTFWSKKTSWNPDNLAGWSGGLAVGFSTTNNGLWSHDGSSWSKLTTWNPTGMSGWNGGLAVGFSTTNDGLWSYDGSSWRKLTSWNPDNLAGWSGGLAVDFGTDGLWSYDGSSWSRLTTWNPTGMSGWGGGLAVDFGADGLWNYDGTAWSKKTSWQCENMADVDLN